MTIALVAALEDELATLLADMGTSAQRERVGAREVYVGDVEGTPCVATLSGIGKVAAASTTTALIERFAPTALLFVGVAGGLGAEVRIGDVVVATTLVQHDMDASPLFERFEVPLTGKRHFATDIAWTDRATRAAHAGLARDTVPRLDGPAPRVHRGLIASGDRFVHDADHAAALRAALPGVLAVEMEGAAVAQVCDAYGVPCAVIRIVSDRADATAAVDFIEFTRRFASPLNHTIVVHALRDAYDASRAHPA